MARHALKRFLSALIFLLAFVSILRLQAFAGKDFEILVIPNRVIVGHEFLVVGSISGGDVSRVRLGTASA